MGIFQTDSGDRFLVARMLRGDEAAFSEFFDSHFSPLFRFALPRVNNDPDVAEEVVQATLCQAMRKLATFRGEASLLTWLCTFCRHEISAWFEKKRKVPPMVDLSEDLPEIRAALESLAGGIAKPDEELRRKEAARMVQLVLDRLPARYGDALEWKYIDGLSVNEIAERLNIAPKAAESVLSRARVAFRDGFTTVFGNWKGLEA